MDNAILAAIISAISGLCGTSLVAIIAAVAGLVGVWVGNNTSRNTQKEILRIQREWELDNQRREYKRLDLTKAKELVYDFMTLSRQRMASGDQSIIEERQRIISELLTIRHLYNPEMQQALKALIGLYGNSIKIIAEKDDQDLDFSDIDFIGIYEAEKTIKDGIEKLIDETYLAT